MKLKMGFELHRVLSFHKLFCGCKYKKNNLDWTPFYNRHYGGKLNRYLKNDYTCDYEEDEKPPEINQKILKKLAIVLSNISNLKILKQIIFSRKEILDGSMVSGYQITALVAEGGQFEISTGKKIQIDKIYLETDSGVWTPSLEGYRVDRLGIPLLELTTKPLILEPFQAIEVLKKLQKLLNPYGFLPKGNETIRQDINFSIEGHPRVELKGVSTLSGIPEILERHLKKMINSTEDKISTWKVLDNLDTEFLRYPKGSKRMFRETQLPVIKIPTLKVKKFLDNLEPVLLEKLLNLNLSPRKLRIISKYFERGNLLPMDWMVLEHCLKNEGGLNLYNRYISEKICGEAILKGNALNQEILSLEKSKELWNKLGLRLFFKDYRYRIPRSFRLNLPTS